MDDLGVKGRDVLNKEKLVRRIVVCSNGRRRSSLLRAFLHLSFALLPLQRLALFLVDWHTFSLSDLVGPIGRELDSLGLR